MSDIKVMNYVPFFSLHDIFKYLETRKKSFLAIQVLAFYKIVELLMLAPESSTSNWCGHPKDLQEVTRIDKR